MQVDLRSDTVTRPTPGMREAMFSAKVGDDVFGEDGTINALQNKAAKLFGVEAALFCPSGTMCNQIAIKAHTYPPGQIIVEKSSHTYLYEGGGMAFHSGLTSALLEGNRGRLTADQIQARINSGSDTHLALTQIVSLENTHNKGGGSLYDFNEILRIKAVCAQNNLKLHLDGARLWNALVETPETAADYGNTFDSISVCLSKGLGCPVGSLLLGSKDFIIRAHRLRKLFGGGMRQAGFLAAAGIYALDHQFDRLKEDHVRTKAFAEMVNALPYVEEVLDPQTNILLFRLNDTINPKTWLAGLAEKGILAVPFGEQWIRFVLHLDITDDMVEFARQVLKA